MNLLHIVKQQHLTPAQHWHRYNSDASLEIAAEIFNVSRERTDEDAQICMSTAVSLSVIFHPFWPVPIGRERAAGGVILF